MFSERRKARRSSTIKQPQAELTLYAGHLKQQVNAIQDASPYGICVLVERAIDKGTDIVLSYQAEDIRLELFGAVVWSSPVDATLLSSQTDPLYRVGIAFEQDRMQQNTLLFRALLDCE